MLSFNIQLYHCIAVFPRLYPNTTYMSNTDYTEYTDNKVVFVIWTDNVNAICATIFSNMQLWYCIAAFPRLYPNTTYMPNTDYTDYTDNRVVFIIWTDNFNGPLIALNWNLSLRVSGGYFLTVRAQLDWIKGGQEARKKTTKKDTLMTIIWKRPLSIHWRCLKTNPQNSIVVTSTPY